MGGLIERAGELSTVRDMLTGALDGCGASLLVNGPAGIGRSALVARAREVAREAGFTVLSSCPTPLSADLSHVLVRDWLAPLVRVGRPGAPPFDGPATNLAEAMVGLSEQHPAWNLASLDYALTWVLESLSGTRPLLLVVDDLQWLDVASLQLLDLLSARLRDLPVGLLLTLRCGEPVRSAEVVDRIAARARKFEPAPLSVAGVEAARHRLGDAAPLADVPAEELHRLTGGVPLLLHELLRSGRHDGAPREVVEWVRERLARLGGNAVRVARATAVLGEDARFDAVAQLSGLSVADLADPLALLTNADILATEMWRARPASPLLGDAVLGGMTPSERSELHRAAVRYLTVVGTPTHQVVEHLVHTLPADDPAVAERLLSAGRQALEEGTPETAARLLLRASAETRPEDTQPEVLALAASANLLAGLPAEAFHLWSRAVEQASDACTRARLLMELGDARCALGAADTNDTYRRAVETLAQAGLSSSPLMEELTLRRGLVRAWSDGAGSATADPVALSWARPVGAERHADRLFFALSAMDVALSGENRGEARDLALRALGSGELLAEETALGAGFRTATTVLVWADAYAEALQALNAAVKDGHERGSALLIATASYCRGLVHFREGRLRQAGGDFQPAMSLRARGWRDFGAHAVAGAALTNLALGQYDDALALEPALRAAAARGHFPDALPLAAAGLVRAAQGDHEHAVHDFRRAARLMGPAAENGSVVPWRELSVWSLNALGRRDEATELAEAALAHARRWGAPRGLGLALCALAHVSPRDRAVELLREALTCFELVSCADHRARAWADLGSLLLHGTAAEREEGVVLLRRTLHFGRVGRVPLATQRATRLLMQAGEHVTEPTPRAASLTRGERRVAELAVAGATNRQIAQKLEVTVKAVEWHLSNAYRKLGISSRAELATSLYGEVDPSSSSAM